jgi:hypothetical protein
MTITNTGLGDVITCQQVAFAKIPDINYAKEAGMNEWTFDVIKRNTVLGAG